VYTYVPCEVAACIMRSTEWNPAKRFPGSHNEHCRLVLCLVSNGIPFPSSKNDMHDSQPYTVPQQLPLMSETLTNVKQFCVWEPYMAVLRAECQRLNLISFTTRRYVRSVIALVDLLDSVDLSTRCTRRCIDSLLVGSRNAALYHSPLLEFTKHSSTCRWR
jgi:hypothetical protein